MSRFANSATRPPPPPERALVDPDCGYCEEPLLPGERVMMDGVIEGGQQFHRECLIRMVFGSAAHQLHECGCYGGTRHDPPGLSLRASARLAMEAFALLADPNREE